MLNIHVYPSPLTNESRMLREATSLQKLRIFKQIILVGITSGQLPAEEQLAPGLSLRRLGRGRQAGAGLVRKILSNLSWSIAVLRAFRREPLGCINCHAVSVLPLCTLLKLMTGARLVYDAHELESQANGLGPLRRRMARAVEGLFIHRADHCIFVGEAIRQWYVREYRLRRASVLYNCPRLSQPEPSDYFRQRFGIPGDMPIFLYQGILGEGRGLRALMAAFAGLGDRAAMVVMGYGPMMEWVRAEASRLENVFFHEAAPPTELLRYTAAADFGLSVIEGTSLSYEYSMPNKLFEYVMAGKPVLVAPTVEQRRFVEETGVGVVARDTTTEGVREGVEALLKGNRQALAEAVAKTRLEYCWERQEILLRDIYMRDLGFHQ